MPGRRMGGGMTYLYGDVRKLLQMLIMILAKTPVFESLIGSDPD